MNLRKEKILEKDINELKNLKKKKKKEERIAYSIKLKFVPLRGITPYPENVEKSIVTGDDYECCNSYYRPGTEIWFCAPVSFLVSRLWPAPWIRNSLENTVTPSADTSGCTWSGNRATWEKYNWINKLPRNLAANLFTPTTATSAAEVESIKWPIHPSRYLHSNSRSRFSLFWCGIILFARYYRSTFQQNYLYTNFTLLNYWFFKFFLLFNFISFHYNFMVFLFISFIAI